MYINRHIEKAVERLSKSFSAVVITGPRQVGKSTMIKKCVNGVKYITFDDYVVLESAKENPSMFLNIYNPPLIIDELQYSPNILRGVKKYIDESKEKGQFFIIGSQSFHLMQDVSESLAGRTGILQMLGLSLRELQGIEYYEPFLPTISHIQKVNEIVKPIDYWEIWNIIHKGSFPDLAKGEVDEKQWRDFYNAYLRTYIERDIKALVNVQDESSFLKFIKAVAGLTGQMLNLTTIAEICGKDITTVQKWLSILISSGLVYLLQPYSNNLNKRLVKTPKLYFLDTGLACFLTSWNTKEQLADGAMKGAMFESFVVAEIIKSYYNDGICEPPIYYYRDKDKNEVDIIIESNGKIYPIEVKCKSNPNKDDIKAFKKLESIAGKEIMAGCVICLSNQVGFVDEKNFILPIYLI